MKRILITGANSYIGTSFDNYMKRFGDAYVIDTVDTVNSAWKQADFSTYDVVFHVAGIAHVDAKKKMKDLYYTVNRDLTIEIAMQAKESGIKQFIFMSSIIVYGESKSLKPVVITKDTIPVPNGFYGDSKLQAEQGILPLQSAYFHVVVLRPPMIYGKGCKGNFPRLVELAQKLPVFPEFPNERSMLYIENLCEFIHQVIDLGMYGIFFPQNREYVNTTDLVKTLAKVQGRSIGTTKLFNPLIRLLSKFVRSISKLFGSLVYERHLSVFDEFDYQMADCSASIEAYLQ